jgi:hypothetical protein
VNDIPEYTTDRSTPIVTSDGKGGAAPERISSRDFRSLENMAEGAASTLSVVKTRTASAIKTVFLMVSTTVSPRDWISAL